MSLQNVPVQTYRGDTWSGFPSITMTQSGAILSVTGAAIRMQVRANRLATPVLDLSTSPAPSGSTVGITIDASGNFFTVGTLVTDWTPGIYSYDIQIVLASGVILTPVGGTWTMLDDITHV